MGDHNPSGGYPYYGQIVIVDSLPSRAVGPVQPQMTRRALAAWVAGSLATGILVAALGWGLVHAAKQASSAVGSRVPDVTIRSLDGEVISLRVFTGTPMVINFWASWCVACRQEAPVLAAAAEQAAGQVLFFGIDMKDTDAAARAYEAEVKSPYPVGPAIRGSYHDFGVTAPPETFFVNRSGTVVSRIIGPVDSRRMKIFISQIVTDVQRVSGREAPNSPRSMGWVVHIYPSRCRQEIAAVQKFDSPGKGATHQERLAAADEV